MKYVEIILTNGQIENIIDNDSTNLNKYIEDISKIFMNSNISILQFNGSDSNIGLIIKPSDISLIKISESTINVEDEVIRD